MIVIDCSYALAMVMPDEQRPSSLRQIESARLLVPPIWPYEVANAFRSAVRRGRVTGDEISGVCARLEALQFELATGHDTSVRQRYFAAMAHGLTAYDAAYIELALQRRGPLATLDMALARVARQAGLDVLH